MMKRLPLDRAFAEEVGCHEVLGWRTLLAAEALVGVPQTTIDAQRRELIPSLQEAGVDMINSGTKNEVWNFRLNSAKDREALLAVIDRWNEEDTPSESPLMKMGKVLEFLMDKVTGLEEKIEKGGVTVEEVAATTKEEPMADGWEHIFLEYNPPTMLVLGLTTPAAKTVADRMLGVPVRILFASTKEARVARYPGNDAMFIPRGDLKFRFPVAKIYDNPEQLIAKLKEEVAKSLAKARATKPRPIKKAYA